MASSAGRTGSTVRQKPQGNGNLQVGLVIASLFLIVGQVHAQESSDDLRKLVEQQSQQLEQQQQQLKEMKQRLDALSDGGNVKPASATTNRQPPPTANPPKSLEPKNGQKKKDDKEEVAPPQLDEPAIKSILDKYLQANPGIGMPAGVQTGFDAGQGFFIRSAAQSALQQLEG